MTTQSRTSVNTEESGVKNAPSSNHDPSSPCTQPASNTGGEWTYGQESTCQDAVKGNKKMKHCRHKDTCVIIELFGFERCIDIEDICWWLNE